LATLRYKIGLSQSERRLPPEGGDRFPGPYTQIAVPAFKISYVADCRRLFDGATPQTFVEETVQLSLTRQ